MSEVEKLTWRLMLARRWNEARARRLAERYIRFCEYMRRAVQP